MLRLEPCLRLRAQSSEGMLGRLKRAGVERL